MKKALAIFSCMFLMLIGLTGCIVNNPNEGQAQTRKATTNDLIMNFQLKSEFFTADTYILTLQAQETITGLSLDIDFLTSNGVVMKNEILYIGKVVPGNTYRFELNQTGLNPSDLNKISRFYVRVNEGTVEL